MKKILFIAILMAALAASAADRVVVAYLTSWKDAMPDPTLMTHINYAFGHVTDSFDGVEIHNPSRLDQVVALKKQNPNLKVLLSVGGWGSGNFSEMAADPDKRKAFAKDCARVVKEHGLDGIDIDWEYPTSAMAGISASPDDTANFTLLMQDLRKALGKDKELTLATVCSADYIDFPAIMPSVDFVNIMAYDMGNAPSLHSGLFHSEHTLGMCSSEAVQAHLKAGVPREKLVMGMPFYGRGGKKYHDFQDFKDTGYSTRFTEHWDESAKVPYLTDSVGELVFGYENVRSIGYKCQYIKDQKLRGGMYWSYDSDADKCELAQAVKNYLIDDQPFHDPMHNVIVLAECAGQHKAFVDAAMKWLFDESAVQNLRLQLFNNADCLADRDLMNRTDLIIQLDFPPYTWPEQAQQNFIEYIEQGRGGWIGFHHATLLGDFDGWPMWKWFSNFMGDIEFKNYIAPLADGTVHVEAGEHPLFDNVPSEFVLQDDEWYTYHSSPRPNVTVLANVDEASYTPASDVTMGDHPVIWTNPAMQAPNVYFQFGHSPKLLSSPEFCRLFHNAIALCLK